MGTIAEVTKLDPARWRRRHSAEFKANVVAACQHPGVTIASVALANGINANLLRRCARLNGHDVYVYLKDVLARLPTQPASRIGGLLPYSWQSASI